MRLELGSNGDRTTLPFLRRLTDLTAWLAGNDRGQSGVGAVALFRFVSLGLDEVGGVCVCVWARE